MSAFSSYNLCIQVQWPNECVSLREWEDTYANGIQWVLKISRYSGWKCWLYDVSDDTPVLIICVEGGDQECQASAQNAQD